MNILLGIYGSPTFSNLSRDTRNETYPFFDLLEDWDNGPTIIDIVALACSKCDIIYFSLDNIQLPLDTYKSYTCSELSLILSNKHFMDKTIFYLDNKELSKSEFEKWYKE